jgi:hypothetical protein
VHKRCVGVWLASAAGDDLACCTRTPAPDCTRAITGILGGSRRAKRAARGRPGGGCKHCGHPCSLRVGAAAGARLVARTACVWPYVYVNKLRSPTSEMMQVLAPPAPAWEQAHQRDMQAGLASDYPEVVRGQRSAPRQRLRIVGACHILQTTCFPCPQKHIYAPMAAGSKVVGPKGATGTPPAAPAADAAGNQGPILTPADKSGNLR